MVLSIIFCNFDQILRTSADNTYNLVEYLTLEDY